MRRPGAGVQRRGAEDMPRRAGVLLQARRLAESATAAELTVATAESCTGGQLAAALTAAAGASSFYVGGVVAYADEAKIRHLGVDPREIEAHGAVSRQVALAMASGGLARFGAGLAMAVTGVAGPGGGTPEKPVGTVWIAVARPGRSDVRRAQFSGDRRAVQDQSVAEALEMAAAMARIPRAPSYL